ncbi:cytochrome P450 [Gordonia sp. NPDC003422]
MSTALGPAQLPWSSDRAPTDYARLRALHGPVGHDDASGAWLILGYEAARSVLTGRGWTSDPMASEVNRQGLDALGISEPPLSRTMLLLDGDDHARQRDSVRNVFTPRYIAQLSDGVVAIADDIIAPIGTRTPFDFMTEIAQPFPIAVIAEWLGLDLPAAQTLWTEAAAIAPALDGILDAEAAPAAAGALAALVAEFLPLAAQRRTEPGDDLLSLLATDPRLDLDEVVMNAILLAVAGHETTANLLGGGIARLLTGPVGRRPIDRIDADDPAVLDEMLRLDGPAQAVFRVATFTQQLGGHTIGAGDRAIVVLGSANRDPDVFDNPDQFRLDRDGRQPNLAFGHGPHRCLGAALARLEVTVALRMLIGREPVLDGPPVLRDSRLLRGLHSLPMRFLKGSRS